MSDYANGFAAGAQLMLKVVKIDKRLSDADEERLLKLFKDSLETYQAMTKGDPDNAHD